ncbi:M23 family metallopeptidase [Arthrobacter sp. PsM3]|uniref:M23 family metallopeptidase n=1 Tax=Arthrobacter sp. PsM3 TaxID=3030531 RepID=UPI00263A4924|nr:M23 family metallopeptidase [Arthrobacter sp. PsM3]MDN4645623.1 M23 family metallopeptidase [Arthrobacter sp. PsM3]
MPSPPPASGVVGPGILNPGTADSRPVPGADASSTAAFTADALALVAYSRSPVETTSKDGVPGELNVASAGLKRPAEGFLMAPLESIQETSPFGLRTSPISGSAGEFHWGQDYAAACGTRVYAADAGVVRAVGWHPWGGGNRVEIDHGNGLITTYNHLEGIAVKKGDSVRVGEVIARVGTTGSSTGCHLHFETILNGIHKNPHDWILLPISQTDQLGALEMTSYAPDAGSPSNATLGWAIPVSDNGKHVVTGGVQETLIPTLPGTANSSAAAPASPTPSIWDALSPTKTMSDTPTLEPSPSPSGTGGATTAGGSQTPGGTPAPSDPPPPSDPGTPATPPAASPTPEPTTPPAASPTPEPTTPPAASPTPEPTTPAPPAVVAPVPSAPAPPVVAPAPPAVVAPVPSAPAPPVVAPAPPPQPTSAPAAPAPPASIEPPATTDPSLAPTP